jgi:sigma-B regulation protein RsbU (phosphoserine phosphatase)
MNGYLDTLPCGYFSFGHDGRLKEVNTTLCALLQVSREDVIGQTIETILTIPSRIFFQTHFFPLLKMQGHAEEIYITLLTKDKNYLPVLLSARRDMQDGTERYACAFITVHNRKKFEDELVAAKKEAERALRENAALQAATLSLQQHAEQLDEQLATVNKVNDELRQFTHVVSHELQEPLRKISIFTKMLDHSCTPEAHPNIYPTLGRLLSANERLRDVVSGLQQFMWLLESPLNFSEVDISFELQTAASELAKEYDQGLIELSTGLLPVLTADRDQIQLLCYHALSNCVKYRKKGEKASITVSGTIIEKNMFRAIEDRYKFVEFLKIDIADNGTGFNPEYKDQVFELFRRLNTDTTGKGLGLALCKKVAENHCGYIGIDSRENEGTTLSVLLPIHQQTCPKP